jgi:hypothetical protein
MSNVIFFNSYKLKKGADVQAFMLAAETLNKEYISQQKGYISFQLFVDGETWADATTFETMTDAKSFANSDAPNELAEKFYAFLNLNSCKSNFFTTMG